MTRLAQRTERIDSSGIRKVFSLAADMDNPVNLSIGQPDFDVPDQLKQVAVDAINAGANRYTLTSGTRELRARLREAYAHKQGIDTDEVIVTSGVSGGLLLAFMALFDPGDEVIVPEPYFVMYKHLLNLLGARPVFVDTYPDFRLDPDRIAAAITDKTRGILINTPANPTGVVYRRDDLQAVARLAQENDLVLISDEIYEAFCYDEEFVSLASLAPDVVLLGGFSKSVAMTGWRLGFAIAPAPIIAAMEEIQQYTFVCAPSVAQEMGLAALELDTGPVCDAYRTRRDILYDGLKDYYHMTRPGGAFYAFPQAPDEDGDAFVLECIDNNLLCVPGSVFSERKTHFRLSFAASEQTLRQGVEILKRLSGR